MGAIDSYRGVNLMDREHDRDGTFVLLDTLAAKDYRPGDQCVLMRPDELGINSPHMIGYQGPGLKLYRRDWTLTKEEESARDAVDECLRKMVNGLAHAAPPHVFHAQIMQGFAGELVTIRSIKVEVPYDVDRHITVEWLNNLDRKVYGYTFTHECPFRGERPTPIPKRPELPERPLQDEGGDDGTGDQQRAERVEEHAAHAGNGSDPVAHAATRPSAVGRLVFQPVQGGTDKADPASLKKGWTRDRLIKLCLRGMVPQESWNDRDSFAAQKQLGKCLVLLMAGCWFRVVYKTKKDEKEHGNFTDDNHVIVTFKAYNFQWMEDGDSGAYPDGYDIQDSFYLPTEKRLGLSNGDWY